MPGQVIFSIRYVIQLVLSRFCVYLFGIFHQLKDKVDFISLGKTSFGLCFTFCNNFFFSPFSLSAASLSYSYFIFNFKNSFITI